MSQIIASIIGSIGFSIVFGIRRAYMLPIAVNAGLSWAVYLLVNGFAGDFAANMVSAMFCSLVAALMARRLRVPTVVLQMPATVPMIPGGSLYYTIYYVFAGDMPTATAMNELHTMTDAVSEVLDMTVEAYVTQSVSLARSVEPLEEVVDTMKEQLKSRHIERLGEGGCTMQTGIHFLDIVHDLEKISDHCSNIAIYTIQLVEGAEEFDTHAYAKAEFKSGPQFESKLKFYQSKYLSRLNDVAQA